MTSPYVFVGNFPGVVGKFLLKEVWNGCDKTQIKYDNYDVISNKTCYTVVQTHAHFEIVVIANKYSQTK